MTLKNILSAICLAGFTVVAMPTTIPRAEAQTRTTAPAADPAATVRALSEALMTDRYGDALALFAPDAGFAYSLNGPLTTGERFHGWLQSDIVRPRGKFTIERVRVEGGTVDALVVWGRGTPSQAIRYVFDVRDGRITAWRIMQRS